MRKFQDEAINNIDAKDEVVKTLEEKLDNKINEDKRLRKEVEELKATLENIARSGAERMSKAESDDQPEEKELNITYEAILLKGICEKDKHKK